MHSFKDTNGTEWAVAVNVATVKRVRQAIKIDLLDPKISATLAGDPIALVDTLFVLCEDQAKERGVSDEQFGAAMAGDTIAHAVDALLEEIVDFSRPRERARGKKALKKMREWNDRVQTMLDRKQDSPEVTAKLDDLMSTVEAEVDARIADVGNSPGSSASSPGD